MKIIYPKNCLFFNSLKKLTLTLLFLIGLGFGANAQITGLVYRDFNADGQKNGEGENGVAGVVVKATPSTGTAISTTTNATGAFSIPVGGTGPYRIEFSNYPAGHFAGPNGLLSGTSVQFVDKNTSTANLGIAYPSDYCQDNPKMAVTCFVNGNPLTGGSSGEEDAFVAVPYNEDNNTFPTPDLLARAKNVGAIWGVAYQKESKIILTSAVTKRHVGFGKLGIGGIYQIDINGNIDSLTNVKNLGIDVGTDPHVGLPANKDQPSVDAASFQLIGKIGIGDIDISEDGKYLYMVNLKDRKIYRIFINNPVQKPTKTDVVSYDIPNPCGLGNADYRPWGLKFYRGKLYIGVVCSGETAQDKNQLSASVYAMDAATGIMTSVLNFPLTYKKGYSDIANTNSTFWQPWTKDFSSIPAGGFAIYPQPILSDIEFDVEGSMIIGIIDRLGHQMGVANESPNGGGSFTAVTPGDILRAEPNGTGFKLEANGKSGNITTTGANNTQGPSGGEYYVGDDLFCCGNKQAHQETFNGGLALRSGSNEVVYTALDPVQDIIFSGGFRRLSNTTGLQTGAYYLYKDTADITSGSFGKATGVGDIEILCDMPSLEIGNRVWNDLNGNGIQDPNETGIGNVVLELYKDGLKVGQTSTDADGNYFFNSNNVNQNGAKGVLANMAYEIRVLGTQPALTGLNLTAANTGLNDNIDSDAILNGTSFSLALTTGNLGENNHTYDFGVNSCPTFSLGSKAICVGNTLELSATPSVTGSINAYAWSGPSGFSSTLQNPTRSNTTLAMAGIYTLRATGQSGCIISNTTSVSIVASPVISTQSMSVCEGGTISISASAPSATAYSWAGPSDGSPSGFASTLQQPTRANADVNMAGFYTVSVTGLQGCTASTTVTVAVSPTVLIPPSVASFCPGGNATLSIDGGTEATYLWTNGATGTSINVSIAGTFDVDVRDAKGCKSKATFTTLLKPLPNLILKVNSPVCAGNTIGLSATGASTYEWTGVNFSSTLQNPSIPNSTELSSGIYSVVATGTNNCFVTSTTNVLVTPKPNLDIKNNGPLCAGNTLSLAATSSESGQYTWAGPAGFSSTSQNPSKTGTDFTMNGVYSVTLTTTSGCVTTASTSVKISASPLASAKSNGPLCLGTTLGLSVTPAASYQWAGPSGFASTLQNPSKTNIGQDTAGEYSVTVISAEGCSAVSKVKVDISPNPIPNLSSNSPICVGSNLSLSASGGGQYAWSGPLAYRSTLQNPTIVAATKTMEGIYTLSLTASSGCTASATLSVQINTQGASASVNSPVCEGSEIILQATAGSTYSWRGPSSFTATAQSPNITNATSNMAGIYSVTVSGQSGCVGTATVSVKINPKPIVTASSNSPICTGNNLNLSSTGGTSYNWQGPSSFEANTQNPSIALVNVSKSGIYTVTANNSNQCTNSATVSVVINNRPNISLNSNGPLCAGSALNLSVAGGDTYAWKGPEGFSSTSATPTRPITTTAMLGVYSATASNSTGCSATATINVQISEATAKATASSPSYCIGASIELSASAGQNYTWSGPNGFGSTEQNPVIISANSSMSGIYSLIVGQGTCTASSTLSIAINQQGATASTKGSVCEGNALTLGVSSGEFYSWSGPSGFSSTLQNPVRDNSNTAMTGVYSVTVSGKNGCAGSATVSATVNSNPKATASDVSIKTNDILCEGKTLAFSAGLANAYQWAGPEGFASTLQNPIIENVTIKLSGIYSLTVSSSDACSASTTLNVIVKDCVVPFGSIGNFVWKDTNDNGIQDTGETGIKGINVELYQLQGGNYVKIKTILTDLNGAYLFDSLVTGDYKVKFVADGNYTPSKQNQGTNPALDSDAGVDGFSQVVGIDTSKPFNDLSRNNTTIDAGFVPKPTCVNPNAPTVKANKSSICVGESVKLVGSSAGAKIAWYLTATAGTAIKTTNSDEEFIVTPSNTTTYYAEAFTKDSCRSLTRTPVTVVVGAKPVTPTCSGNTSNSCPETFVDLTKLKLSEISTVGGVLEWHQTALPSSAIIPNPEKILLSGNYYLFEKSKEGCYSNPAIVVVNILSCECENPAKIDAGQDQTLCANDSVFVKATLSGSATKAVWSTDGSGVFGNINALETYYLPSTNDLKTGYVHLITSTIDEDLGDNCDPVQDALVVNFNPIPDQAFGLSCADSVLCTGESTRLFGLTNGGTIRWYLSEKGGNPLATVASAKGFEVSPLQTTTYWAEAVSQDGCVNPKRTPITVKIKKCFTDLTIEKKLLTQPPYKKGQTLVYAITVSNLGPIDANDVVVTDKLPNSLTFLSSVPPTQYDALTGKWNVGKLSVGSSRTLAITTKANAMAVITNTAFVESVNNDITKTKNDTSTVTISTLEVANLSLKKTVSNAKPFVGDEIVYTIEIKNAGPDAATNIEITDIIPNELAFVSSSDLKATGQTITVKLPELKSGFGKLYTYKVKVLAEGSITNAAEITMSDQQDPNSSPGNGIGKNEDDESSISIDARYNCDILPPVLSCSSTNICAGDSLSIFASSCKGEVLWSTGQKGQRITVAPKVTTSYWAVCSETKCRSDKAEITIVVGNPKTVELSCANTAICFGGNSTINAFGCENGNIIWSNGMQGTSITVKPSQTSTYTAYCQVGSCISESAKGITISVTKEIEKVITKDLVNTCPSQTVNLWDGVESQPFTKGGVFEFHTEAGPLSKLITDPTKIAQTGAYIIYEKTLIGCYSKPCIINVLITDCGQVPACKTNPATAIAGKNEAICSQKTIKLNGKIGGAASSSKWTSTGTGTFDNPLLLDASYSVSQADIQKGSIVLRLSTNDPDGTGSCSAASDSLIVSIGGVKIKPTITVLGSTNLCLGDSVTLAVVEKDYQYLWNTGQTFDKITVAKRGVYKVILVAKDGCISTESEPVEVSVGKAIPSPKVSETLSNTCPNPMVDLTKSVLSSLSQSDSKFTFQTSADKLSPKVLNLNEVGQGIYYVFERTALGCYSQGAKVTVILKNCIPVPIDTTQKDKTADLSLRKVSNVASVKQGRPIVFSLIIKNAGPAKATNVEVKDLLPGGLTFESGNGIKYDAITNSVATKFDSIAVGDSARVTFTLIGNQIGKITNRAEITKSDQKDPDSTPNNGLENGEDDTSLASVNIVSPDPLGDNAIGLAKYVSNFTRLKDASYDVEYRFVLKNYGKTKVDSIQILDSLENVFPRNVIYKIVNIKGSSQGKLKVNPRYDGLNEPNLLERLNGGSLAAGASDTISFVINIVADSQIAPFLNSATATAKVNGQIISDVSVDGKDPDANGDGNPAEAGSTPLFILGLTSNLFIPEGFSPNGDGINDKFVIQNLENEVTAHLKIYSNWGLLVFEQENYKNDWDGTANVGTQLSVLGKAGLPMGTYFYSIKLSDNRVFIRHLTISY